MPTTTTTAPTKRGVRHRRKHKNGGNNIAAARDAKKANTAFRTVAQEVNALKRISAILGGLPLESRHEVQHYLHRRFNGR